MGQYYKTINIDNAEWMDAHAFDSGLKLMEHSYVDNDYVCAVKQLLSPGGPWHKARIVWAGDYGDKKFKDFVDDKDVIAKFAEELQPDENLYSAVPDNKELSAVKPLADARTGNFILVNHSKKLCVLYNNLKDSDGWYIDPLPLLTSDGNGLGGGDYSGQHQDQCGAWAGDSISIETVKPEGYNILVIDFKEDR